MYLKVPWNFFRGTRSSAGSHLFALLLGSVLPSQGGSLVLLPSLALVTATHRSSWQFFRTPSDPLRKVKFTERTGEPRWHKLEKRRGLKSCAEKERPYKRSVNRREPALLICPPKNLWNSTFNRCYEYQFLLYIFSKSIWKISIFFLFADYYNPYIVLYQQALSHKF